MSSIAATPPFAAPTGTRDAADRDGADRDSADRDGADRDGADRDGGAQDADAPDTAAPPEVEPVVIPGQGPGDPLVPTRRPIALSPSRASDFKTCPLLYRYRAVDRLAEPPSAPAVRGTLVHSVLERMFSLPAADRTPELTAAQVGPLWAQMVSDQPDLSMLVPADQLTDWLASAQQLVRTYFTLEDPRRFSPEACELAVEVEAAGSVPLRGFIDRVDLAPTGELRVVDYKTGRSPGPDFESRALYQLKFYALMMYRLRGVVAAQLKLIYLADGLSLQYDPTENELLSFENGIRALWSAMTRALDTGDFPANPSSMCGYCAHQAICPAYGGTPPPYPGRPGREQVLESTKEGQAGDTALTESAVKVPIDL